jgi:hypothetical protein
VLVGVVNNTKALEYIIGDQPDTDSEEEAKMNRERDKPKLYRNWKSWSNDKPIMSNYTNLGWM